MDWATCRWQNAPEWDRHNALERDMPVMSFEWKQVAEPVMLLYTESTDGSYIEYKESALVWHHQYADPDFGSWQAKEMQDHLESVLANEPVTVKSGAQIVEVTPQVYMVSALILLVFVLVWMRWTQQFFGYVPCFSRLFLQITVIFFLVAKVDALHPTSCRYIFPALSFEQVIVY